MRSKIITVLAAAFSLGVVSAASAADMPTKAPIVKAPAAVMYNWTGLYAGVEGGGVFASHGFDWGPEFPSISDSVSGPFFGGTLGFNWQFQQFVVGVEGDISWADIKGDHVGNACSTGFSCSMKADWFATLRGRGGFLVMPNLLVYGTGGGAWANVARAQFTTPAGLATPDSWTTYSGWTAGAGLEWMFMPNWSAKAEYLYTDLGREAFGAQNTLSPSHQWVGFNLVRVGVNYKFWTP